jgi:hypothetical protein
MDPGKVMEDPVDIEALLKALFLFGVGVGFSAIGRTPPAQGGIEGLHGLFSLQQVMSLIPKIRQIISLRIKRNQCHGRYSKIIPGSVGR